jgi:hypothetical protein
MAIKLAKKTDKGTSKRAKALRDCHTLGRVRCNQRLTNMPTPARFDSQSVKIAPQDD